MDYLKRFKNADRSLHPRYEKIEAIYGAVVQEEITYVEKRFAQVLLCYGDREMKRKIPITMTVQKLKVLYNKFFRKELSADGHEPDGLWLVMVQKEDFMQAMTHRIHLDSEMERGCHDLEPISNFSPQDGVKICAKHQLGAPSMS